MSNMKCPICPICGGDLIQSKEFPYFYSCQSTNWESDADKLCELDDCSASVPVWEALRRTRKALDVAVDMLKLVYQGNGDPQDIMRYKDNRWTAVRRLCKQTLDQITTLEQKDK